jgi:hypothetical protein
VRNSAGQLTNFEPTGDYVVTFDDSGCQYTYNQYKKKMDQLVAAGSIAPVGRYDLDPYGTYRNFVVLPLLAPYMREFSKAYFKAYPAIIPQQPYITSSDYINKTDSNWVNYYMKYYFGISGNMADAHGPATFIP